MKLFINSTNLKIGGGMQVALSFINELSFIIDNNEYFIACSPEIYAQIEEKYFDKRFKFYVLSSTAKLIGRNKVIKELEKIIALEKIEIVFSVFGPTYWRPSVTHVMGFALPWLINPDNPIHKDTPVFLRGKKLVESFYKRFYIRRDADYYWAETTDVRNRMAKYLGIDKRKTFVVGNTFASHFLKHRDNFDKISLGKKRSSEVRFITISANYYHKNLKIIKPVSQELLKRNIDHTFFLTLEQTEFEKLFGNESESIKNLGKVKSLDCPSIYSQCDILFLPTMLECFSASYPEAMIMRKPILTSYFSFARDICQDSALFFDPTKVDDIISKISLLINDKKLWLQLIDNGVERVQQFPNAKKRCEEFLEICNNIN